MVDHHDMMHKPDERLMRLLRTADAALEAKDIEKAREYYRKVTVDYPEDYRGWRGFLHAVVAGIHSSSDGNWSDLYNEREYMTQFKLCASKEQTHAFGVELLCALCKKENVKEHRKRAEDIYKDSVAGLKKTRECLAICEGILATDPADWQDSSHTAWEDVESVYLKRVETLEQKLKKARELSNMEKPKGGKRFLPLLILPLGILLALIVLPFVPALGVGLLVVDLIVTWTLWSKANTAYQNAKSTYEATQAELKKLEAQKKELDEEGKRLKAEWQAKENKLEKERAVFAATVRGKFKELKVMTAQLRTDEKALKKAIRAAEWLRTLSDDKLARIAAASDMLDIFGLDEIYDPSYDREMLDLYGGTYQYYYLLFPDEFHKHRNSREALMNILAFFGESFQWRR